MRHDLSLSMGPIQIKINESLRPKTTDTYGSLFEFLDGNESATTQDRDLKKKLSEIKRQVNQKITQENEGFQVTTNNLHLTPLPPKDNKIKLKHLLKNMNQSVDYKDSSPIRTTLKNKSNSENHKDIINDKSTPNVMIVNKSKNCLRPKSMFSHLYHEESFISESRPVLEMKDESPKKTVVFKENVRMKDGKIDYSHIEGRLRRYLNKKASVLDNEKEVALWNMYQIESQNKKTSFLHSELDLLNKLAIKGGHHLLKIQKGAAFKEDVAQDNPGQDSYNKSFLRIKEGLKVLREKKQSQLYFDEYGNYISYKKSRSNFGMNPNHTHTSLHSSPSKLTDKSIDKSVDRKTTETNETVEDTQSREGDNLERDLKKKESHLQAFNPKAFSSASGEKSLERLKMNETPSKPPKTLRDYKLYLINKDKRKWLENHRIGKNQREVENIAVSTQDLSSISYMHKIRDMSSKGQRAQLKKIEEELTERRPYRISTRFSVLK